jgi:hypothetical protein
LDRHHTRYEEGVLTVPVSCGACGAKTEFTFDTSEIEKRQPIAAAMKQLREPADLPATQEVNPTREPSQIIDIADWLTLYTITAAGGRAAVESARTLPERGAARRQLIEAAQCLDEALKFFDDDNDLPREESFFTPASRDRFRNHQELFTRQRLVSLRGSLPQIQRR